MLIQPCGLVLTAPNFILTLALLPLLLLNLGATVKSPLAIAGVVVFGVAESLLAQWFDFYEQKVLIDLGESLGKLLLIFFFWSSIKCANSRRSLKLVYFSASSGAEIDGFKVSLNFSTH